MNAQATIPEHTLSFLLSHGVRYYKHSSQSLMDHLQGTYALLKQWDAREALCLAGLFHSVYGTESFKQTLLPTSLRGEVREHIGEEAEILAYLFGAMEKTSLYNNLQREADFTLFDRFQETSLTLTKQELSDLFTMTVANWLEQRERVGEKHKFIRSTEFSEMRPYLLPKAKEAIEAAYGFERM